MTKIFTHGFILQEVRDVVLRENKQIAIQNIKHKKNPTTHNVPDIRNASHYAEQLQ